MGRDESAKGWDESAARACHQPLVQADQNVVPVAVTAGDKLETLRQWASGRCLSADRVGVYSRVEGGAGELSLAVKTQRGAVKTQRGAVKTHRGAGP